MSGRLAAILAGGPARAGARLRRAVADADLVVAADGGMALAEALGVEAQLWVGDFDSADSALRRRHPAVPVVEYPEDKDDLDLELAVAAARQRGAEDLVLIGVFDGRLDQTVAALLVAARLREQGMHVRLLGGEHEAYLLAEGDDLDLQLPRGTLFSLLALRSNARVDVEGARFPLSDAELPFGVGLGLSNRAVGGPSVRVRRGMVALTIEWGEEATP